MPLNTKQCSQMMEWIEDFIEKKCGIGKYYKGRLSKKQKQNLDFVFRDFFPNRKIPKEFLDRKIKYGLTG